MCGMFLRSIEGGLVGFGREGVGERVQEYEVGMVERGLCERVIW